MEKKLKSITEMLCETFLLSTQIIVSAKCVLEMLSKDFFSRCKCLFNPSWKFYIDWFSFVYFNYQLLYGSSCI